MPARTSSWPGSSTLARTEGQTCPPPHATVESGAAAAPADQLWDPGLSSEPYSPPRKGNRVHFIGGQACQERLPATVRDEHRVAVQALAPGFSTAHELPSPPCPAEVH